MSVRKRLLLPDVVANTAGGEIAIVSRQQVLEAMADAVVMQELAGGFITIGVTRVPTGFPDEMVTVSACVEWKDRTDAKSQPEPVAQIMPAEDPVEQMRRDADELAREFPVELDDDALAVAQAIQDAATGDSPDGLDEAALEEEDLSEIPVEAR